MVFMPLDETAETGYHYGFYAGQPLPIAQTTTVSGTMHDATIQWNQRSSSQSANASSVTVNWRSGISYINARCITMTQMTLEYLVPFGILAG